MQYVTHFDQLPTGVMTYADFKPIGHNLILMYYRTADTSAVSLCFALNVYLSVSPLLLQCVTWCVTADFCVSLLQ